jgi:hypothetical protein
VGEHASPGKPFEISKWEVQQAYRKVAANKGAAGADGVSLAEFESDLKNNRAWAERVVVAEAPGRWRRGRAGWPPHQESGRGEGGVRLVLDGPAQSEFTVDRVIAGTGFRIDLARLPFLPAELRSAVRTLNGHPLVSRAGETSVPGLYSMPRA